MFSFSHKTNFVRYPWKVSCWKTGGDHGSFWCWKVYFAGRTLRIQVRTKSENAKQLESLWKFILIYGAHIPSRVISSVTTSLIHKTESTQLMLIYLIHIEKILFWDPVYQISLIMVNRSAVGGWQTIRMDTLQNTLKIMHISHYIIGHAFFSISKHWWHLEHIFSPQDF